MRTRRFVSRRPQHALASLRTTGAIALVAAAAAGCAVGHASSSTATRDPDRKEWIELFNGRNLDGWTAKIAKHEVGDNYANTFRVADGMIQARYDGYGGNYDAQFGHLYFDRPYSYYLVSHEYRFVGELYPGAPSYTLRNSGLMIHSQDPRTMPRNQNFPISVENQYLGGLGDGRPRTTGNMCSPGTMIDFAGKPDPRHCINSTSRTYDGDQWVLAETLVLGDSIVKHIINHDTVLVYTHPRQAVGVVTNIDPAQLTEGKPLRSGFIALQAEGHPIDFRNVRLLDLEGCMDPKASNYKRYYVKSNPAACR
ncbi:MAG TPA: DUF1080 domain-containing protein [Gemmatimonadaceae bacterium]|nr:DUF1080 domain-containing protein [Gemmatimonadaceae bacterium]